MTPILTDSFEELTAAVRADAANLPSLFWLRAYTTLSMERGTTRIRWAKLSGFVSRTAREFGINGLDHAPGRALLTNYRLFQAVGTDDNTVVRDPDELRALDLARSYDVELLPDFQPELPALALAVNQAWEDLRRADRADGALASVLTRWAPEGKSGLLPALIQAQETGKGWLPPETLAQIAQGLGVPLSQAYGVATYYKMLYTKPIGRTIIRVCDDVSCYLNGSADMLHQLSNILWVRGGETTADEEYTLEIVPCLGHCDCAPIVEVGATLNEFVQDARAVLTAPESEPRGIAEGFLLLQDINTAHLHTLDGYIAQDGFRALRRALFEMTPDQIIAEIKAAGLVGRGGAAFPTGLKWELASKSIAALRALGDDEKHRGRTFGYLVCNADESETGTFKDRILLERSPFRLLEGILLAARAIGAEYGYIYIRGEYPLAYQRFRSALEQARANNYIGPNILGSDFSFELEIRRGAGAYECGEETALFESIEGNRGEPRVKPPFPTDSGLFGKPTVINNVETLCNVPFIISNGVSAYRQFGTEKSPGTRLVCLSGQVQRPGTFEIPMGTTLRHVIYELGGGLHPDRSLQAVLVGGAAGAFLTPDQIDVRLAFESLSAIGATFGSGAIMVFDDSANLWGVLLRIARFFKDESCGKCFPCQIGTQRQLEMIERMGQGKSRAGDVQLLSEVGQVMTDASLCGLGQFAATAITSAFKKNLVEVGSA